MVCLVISDLTDILNLGSHFLREYNVSLMFSKNEPLTLKFKGLGTIQSVGSITQNESSITAAPSSSIITAPSTSIAAASSNDHSENFPFPIQNSVNNFHLFKGKVFKFK